MIRVDKNFIFILLLIFALWTFDFFFELFVTHSDLTFWQFLSSFYFSSHIFYRITTTAAILILAFFIDHSLKKVKKKEAEVKNINIEYGKLLSELSIANTKLQNEINQKEKLLSSLEQSEKKHRSLLNQLPIGVYRSTLEGKFLYVNQKLADILGCKTVDELLNSSAYDFYPNPEDRRYILEMQSKDEEGLIEVESILIRKDGEKIVVRDFGKRLFDKDLNITYFDGVLIDVTEQFQSREALKESENKYRSLFNQLTDLYIRFNQNWDIEEVSPSVFQILGYTHAELKGKNFSILLETKELPNLITQENKETYKDILFFCRARDNSEKFLNGDIISLFDREGNKIGYSGVLRDVTNEIQYKNFMTALVTVSRAFDEQKNLYLIGSEILRSFYYLFTPRNFIFGVVRQNSNQIDIYYNFDRFGYVQEDIPLDSRFHPLAEVVNSGATQLFYEEQLQNVGFPKTPKVLFALPLTVDERVIGVLGFYSYTDIEYFKKVNLYYISNLSEHIAKNLYRKLIEEQLNFQIQLLETLVETIPYPICYQDFNSSTVIVCNTSFSKFLNKEKKSIIGHKLVELLDQDLMKTMQKLNEEISNTNNIQTFDYTHFNNVLNKQVFYFWIRSYLSLPHLNQQGIVEVLIDVSERVQYEKEISEALKFNQNILELIPSGILVVDANRNVKVWNHQAEEITGIKADEIIGKTCFMCDYNEEGTFCPLSSESSESYEIKEEKYITKYGEKKILRRKYRKLFDSDGNCTGLIESFEDITDRVIAQNRLKFVAEANSRITNIANLVAQINDKETLIDIILPLVAQITSSVGAIFIEIIEKRGTLAVERIFKFFEGVSESKYVELKLDSVLTPLISKVLSTKELVEIEDILEEMLPFEMSFLKGKRAILSSVNSGEKLHGILVAYDRTEQYLIEEKNLLEQMSLLLATNIERIIYEAGINTALIKEFQLNELRSNLISLISHEFRTPLQAISLSADLLHKYFDKLDNTQKSKQIERIQKAIKDLTDMIEDVTLYNKLSSEYYENQVETVQPKQFFESLLKDYQLYYQDKARIKYKVNSTSEKISIDVSVINIIFHHLLSNAVKYSKENPEVFVNIEINLNQIQIKVQDNGIGIEDSELDKIFDPFYRGRNVKTLAGTGMGLSIVKNAIEKIEGTIKVESKLGEGTTFTLEIPIKI
ncbi:MAG: PAS domain-containing sensor histidine kinase [Candidatus Kapaibacteriales bacterium]